MPVGMSSAQAVVLGNKVYVGGDTPTIATDCNIYSCYFTGDITWKTLKSSPQWSALTTYQERLVLVGGVDPSTYSPTNQLWVMEEEGTWTQPLPPMPTPRWGASAATIQNNLIVAGGKGRQGEYLDVVEVYNGRQWASARSLPRACYVMKSAVLNGIWHLVGGVDRGRKVFCASLESLVASAQSVVTENVWKTLPEVRHKWSSTAVWGGRLMAVGGGRPTSSDILSYSPHTQSWVKVGDLPVGLNSTCTTVLPTGELVVVGGWGTESRSDRVFKGSLRGESSVLISTHRVTALLYCIH